MIRRLTFAGLAVAFTFVLSDGLENAIANGDTRTISLRHMHTDEAITITFKREGRYDAKALEKLNWVLRDWRRDEPTRMDPQLFDVLWEVHRETGATEPIYIVSAYRSPVTNAMLRRRGRGVARFSQHMLGRAIDFFIPGVELADLRIAGLRLQRGGVGFYPTSGSPFVHMDTGGVRHWPRMTRDQLARVFPDGRTVHIPADGKPMANFELALADLDKRGVRTSPVVVAANTTEVPAIDGTKVKRFVASLFGQREEEEDETTARNARTRLPVNTDLTAGPPLPGTTPAPATTAPRPTAVAILSPTLPEERAQTGVPLPRPRPADVEITASLPEAIVGRTTEQPLRATLAYAPAPGLTSPRAPVATPAVLASQLARPIRFGDASRAPAELLGGPMLQFVAELYHPDLGFTRALMAPARATLRVSFSNNAGFAPHTARFVGPAVAALPTVAFDRSVTGSLWAKIN